MNICLRHHFWLMFLVLPALSLPAKGQKQERLPPEILATLPLEEWARQGDQAQIEWKVRIFPPLLTIGQRLMSEFEVSVPVRELRRRGTSQDLSVIVRIAGSGGNWLTENHTLRYLAEREAPKRGNLVYSVQALMRPGEYRARVVLYDHAGSLHSLTSRKFKVPELRNDPLPGLYSDLPGAQFLPAQQGLDVYYRPDVVSPLPLHAATRRRVELELLVNFSQTEELLGRRRAHAYNMRTMLETLKLFCGIGLRNGSLRVSGLDLVERRVVFEQENIAPLDWPRLRATLEKMNPSMVTAKALGGRRQNAMFFRDVLEQRLNAGDPADSSAVNGNGFPQPGAEPPLRVFIIISSAMRFPHGAERRPIVPPPGANWRVYHIRYEFGWGGMWDELHGLIKPLRPKRFDIYTSLDVRKALAAILTDLRKM